MEDLKIINGNVQVLKRIMKQCNFTKLNIDSYGLLWTTVSTFEVWVENLYSNKLSDNNILQYLQTKMIEMLQTHINCIQTKISLETLK